jgi:hypothetical protein
LAGFCEHDNGLSGYINGEEFLDQLSDYQTENVIELQERRKKGRKERLIGKRHK